jgi:hypothetical protein
MHKEIAEIQARIIRSRNLLLELNRMSVDVEILLCSDLDELLLVTPESVATSQPMPLSIALEQVRVCQYLRMSYMTPLMKLAQLALSEGANGANVATTNSQIVTDA